MVVELKGWPLPSPPLFLQVVDSSTDLNGTECYAQNTSKREATITKSYCLSPVYAFSFPYYTSVSVRSYVNRAKDLTTACTIDAGPTQQWAHTIFFIVQKPITKSRVLVATGYSCPKSFLNPRIRSSGQLCLIFQDDLPCNDKNRHVMVFKFLFLFILAEGFMFEIV